MIGQSRCDVLTFAVVLSLDVVTQFEGFVDAGRRAAGNGGSEHACNISRTSICVQLIIILSCQQNNNTTSIHTK